STATSGTPARNTASGPSSCRSTDPDSPGGSVLCSWLSASLSRAKNREQRAKGRGSESGLAPAPAEAAAGRRGRHGLVGRRLGRRLRDPVLEDRHHRVLRQLHGGDPVDL